MQERSPRRLFGEPRERWSDLGSQVQSLARNLEPQHQSSSTYRAPKPPTNGEFCWGNRRRLTLLSSFLPTTSSLSSYRIAFRSLRFIFHFFSCQSESHGHAGQTNRDGREAHFSFKTQGYQRHSQTTISPTTFSRPVCRNERQLEPRRRPQRTRQSRSRSCTPPKIAITSFTSPRRFQGAGPYAYQIGGHIPSSRQTARTQPRAQEENITITTEGFWGGGEGKE